MSIFKYLLCQALCKALLTHSISFASLQQPHKERILFLFYITISYIEDLNNFSMISEWNLAILGWYPVSVRSLELKGN